MDTEFDKVQGTITLSEERYRELTEAEEKLNALEEFGVDNWDGYSQAMASLTDGE